ncbi:hypothetical protein MMC29_003473 [Sticta canariensis]|nr:hypothetical protein [Sticta canariensis]
MRWLIHNAVFHVDWESGLHPSSTTGKENVVGATRTFNFSALNGASGYYQVTEALYRQDKSPDGSFVHGFGEVPDPPVIKIPGGGEYHGEWGLIRGQQTLIPNETAIAWNNWRCDVGFVFPAAAAHEGAIANVSTILQKAGKHTGVDVAPFTIFSEVRQD